MKNLITSLIFILLSFGYLKSQCDLNNVDSFCDSVCNNCTVNIVDLPNNSTHTYSSGVICISGNIQGGVTINVNGANVCFKSTVKFIGNTTINIIDGNVCVQEGAQANPSANVNVNGGSINDCSTAFNPTYGGSGTPCICDSTVIPLSVDNIELTYTNNILSFTTVNEVNLEKYIIQNSIDGVNYFDVDYISPINTRYGIYNYTIVNRNGFYYRIVAIDFNGIVKYSNVVDVSSNLLNNIVIRNNIVCVENLDVNYNFCIFNVVGVCVFTQLNNINNSYLTINDFPSGVYYVVVQTNDIQLVKKIVKHI